MKNESVIGRLLEEISWDGRGVRAFRDGGRGRENVLTAEVLLPLSLLPRKRFLGSALLTSQGAKRAVEKAVEELEATEVALLPDEVHLGRLALVVQPDAYLDSPQSLALVECKRIRSSRFQEEQLAREYLAVHQAAGSRSALMWVILGSPPPVLVAGLGRVDLAEAVHARLDQVHATSGCTVDLEKARSRVEDTIAWTTWQNIEEATQNALRQMGPLDDDVAGCLRRLVDAISRSVEWHA